LAAAGSISGNNVSSVTVGANGLITIQYSGLSAAVCGSATPTVTLQATDSGGGAIKWGGTGGTLNDRCKPANLR
jgi:hypothetical protein